MSTPTYTCLRDDRDASGTLTGKLLWETTLPFAGLATPSTYMVDGRQYIVIAIGGPGFPGELLAYRLSE